MNMKRKYMKPRFDLYSIRSGEEFLDDPISGYFAYNEADPKDGGDILDIF